MGVPFVITVVLNWRNKSDTLECIASLKETDYLNHRIVLVDNFSQDGTVDAVRAHFPDVFIIENDQNLGYAEGNNVGIRYALQQGADYVFVLNNDTQLAPDCIDALVSDLEAHPEVAAAGPKIFYFDPPNLLNFAGGGLTHQGIPYHVGAHQLDGPSYAQSIETDWLTGCAILFRASVLPRVGLFEPKFFLLYEDVDWSLRARKAGFSLRWVADAKLWHKESASFGRTWTPTYLYYFSRNRFLFLERNFPKHRLPQLHRHALQNLFYLVRTEVSPHGGRDERFWRNVVRRGFTDYLLRKFGPRTYQWHGF